MDNSVSILNWIMYGGGAIMIFSFLAVYWTWFQGQNTGVKFWVSSGIASVLALAAYYVVLYVPASVLAQLDMPVKLVVGILTANGFKQVFYDNVTGRVDQVATGK